jgi:hypothetical protein
MVSLSGLPAAARCPNEQEEKALRHLFVLWCADVHSRATRIEAFGKLVEQGLKADVLTRIGQLEQRYRLKCPECGKPFWASPELLGTNWFNTKATGYRCPEKNCQGVVSIGEVA